MNELRAIDRIDASPRFTAEDVTRLNRTYRDASIEQLLGAVLQDHVAGEVAIVSSFGSESAVLLHLVAQTVPDTPVIFLETGKHFPETLAHRDRLTEHLGLTDLRIVTPDPADLAVKDINGLRWSFDPDGCCHIRKVAPLRGALAGFDSSLTGRKSFQSSSRANLPRFELDTSDALARLKINPLIDWDADRIAAYLESHDLPRHPLVAEGYASIGCSPCTRKVAAGEDARAGRWSGWDKTECGIHGPGSDGAANVDEPAEFDPYF